MGFQFGNLEQMKISNPTYESVKNILSEVTDTFTTYDISAVLNGAEIQPNGEVKVEFKIPDGYGTDVAVFYIADDGNFEKLESLVSEDGKTVSAKLTHFSNYAVCKLGTSTMASMLYFNGVDSVSISKRLGHAQVSTTANIYAHIIEEADQRNADILSDIFLKKA